VTAFRRGYAHTRKSLGTTGKHWAGTATARDRIGAGHGPSMLVVAGVGFEPT
jgi:hypothetical protein